MLLVCRRDHRLKTAILHFFPNISICQEEVQLLSANMFIPTVPGLQRFAGTYVTPFFTKKALNYGESLENIMCRGSYLLAGTPQYGVSSLSPAPRSRRRAQID
jgi:hypothetical protein